MQHAWTVAAEQIAQGPTVRSPLSPRLTVLVIEDEPELRALIRGILEDHGYEVLTAGSGSDALAVAKTFPGDIDLLVVDVVLPGANGHAVAQQLSIRWPAVRTLFMSGYVDEDQARASVRSRGQRKGRHFLRKPFSRKELAETVRSVLASSIN